MVSFCEKFFMFSLFTDDCTRNNVVIICKISLAEETVDFYEYHYCKISLIFLLFHSPSLRQKTILHFFWSTKIVLVK